MTQMLNEDCDFEAVTHSIIHVFWTKGQHSSHSLDKTAAFFTLLGQNSCILLTYWTKRLHSSHLLGKKAAFSMHF
jgi:hypothetical protein